MDPRIALASFVVAFIMVLFGLAFGLEAFYQIRESHHYVPQTWFIDICKTVIGVATCVLTLGSLAKIRMKSNKDDKEDEAEKK